MNNQNKAEKLPSDKEIENWSDKNYPDDLGQTNVAAKWMRTEASKVIASKDAEIERLKQSVEYWKNENSKTGNSYLKLLGEYNELKSELERIKTENK